MNWTWASTGVSTLSKKATKAAVSKTAKKVVKEAVKAVK